MSLSVKYQKAQEQLALLEKNALTCSEEHKEIYKKSILAQKQEIQNLGIQIEKASAVNAQRTLANAQCADGKNDGKISWGSKLWNGIKGVGNFFKNMVCDEQGNLSLKKVAIGAGLIAGAALISAIPGGAVFLTGLAVAGGVASGVQIAKGIKNCANAKTDKEAEIACQNIGEGLTGAALSWTGFKAAASASRAVNGGKILGWGRKPIFKKINFEQSGIQTLNDLKQSELYANAKGFLNGKGHLERAFKSEKYLKLIKSEHFKSLSKNEQKAVLKDIDASLRVAQTPAAQAAVPQTQSSATIKSLWDAKTAELAKAPFWKKNKLRKECKKLFALYTRAKGRELNYRVLAEESSAARWKFGQFKGSTARKLTSKGTPYRKNIVKLEKLEKAAAEAKELKDTYIKMVRDGVLPEDKTIPESLLRSPSKAPAVATTTQAPSEVPVNASSIVYDRTNSGQMVDKVIANRFGLNTLDPRYGTSTWGVDSPHKLAALVVLTGTSAATLKDYKPVRIPAEYVNEFKQVIVERSKAAPLSNADAIELARQFLEIKAQQKAEAEAAKQQAQNQTSSATLTATEIGKFGSATKPAYSGSYL